MDINEDEEPMGKVLITTVYSKDSIIKVITRMSIDRLFLLVSKKTDAEQQDAIKKIHDIYDKSIEVKEKKIDLYDIVEIAKTVVDLIDNISNKDEIYVNITPAKKTQSLGVLMAAYKRNDRIKKVLYIPDDSEIKEMITLPILSFDISESQLKILENVEDHDNLSKLADESETSRAMLYRNIKTLKDKGLIEDTQDGLKLTDAGKIARL